MADQQVKEAAKNKNIEECYIKIPKSAVLSELKEQSVKQWQRKWVDTTKDAITKAFFPKMDGRLKLRLNTTPNDNNYSNWSWQPKILFIQVQNNRQSNVPLQKRSSNSATHYI